MNNIDLELFLGLLRHKNISEAAANTALSQPRATQILQRLEREVGCELFTRSHLGIEVTTAGLEFRPYAERMICDRAQGIKAAQQASPGLAGPLHVGVSHTNSLLAVPAILRAFRAKYPNVQLKLTRTLSSKLVEGMQSELFDLCLCFRPMRIAPYVWKPLFSTDLVGIHAPCFSFQIDQTLEQFVRLPLVLPSRNCHCRLLLDTELQKVGVEPTIVMEIDDEHALVSMVRHGAAVSIVPRITVRPSSHMIATPLKGPRVVAEAGLLVKHNATKASNAFVDLVLAEITRRRGAPMNEAS